MATSTSAGSPPTPSSSPATRSATTDASGGSSGSATATRPLKPFNKKIDDLSELARTLLGHLVGDQALDRGARGAVRPDAHDDACGVIRGQAQPEARIFGDLVDELHDLARDLIVLGAEGGRKVGVAHRVDADLAHQQGRE